MHVVSLGVWREADQVEVGLIAIEPEIWSYAFKTDIVLNFRNVTQQSSLEVLLSSGEPVGGCGAERCESRVD